METKPPESSHTTPPREDESTTKQAPESLRLKLPYKIEGSMEQAKISFYELARSRIKHVTPDKMAERQRKMTGRPPFPPAELYVLAESKATEGGNVEILVKDLRIAINRNAFRVGEKDYSDLIPFVEEHEIYEAWLTAKEGAASGLGEPEKHQLALRREFEMAEKQGLGEKLLEWHVTLKPSAAEECRNALAKARKRLRKVS